MIRIGPHELTSRVLLAPMAGISDKPFRSLCRAWGAALTTTEMLSANLQVQLAGSRQAARSMERAVHADEPGPRSVQIAGGDPATMAEAARLNVAHGAEIIDINMGCPVKKVMKQAAGSALLRDEVLVGRILDAVVAAVDVPVTLKIRTGWDATSRNGVRIARLAQAAGIQALAVHGRTRCDLFNGEAEYDTIRAIREVVDIPLFANGDIDTPEKAARVLALTGADAVMIGRAARGRPWLFREIQHHLDHGSLLPAVPASLVWRTLRQHIEALHAFYGSYGGLGIARKHFAWYLEPLGLERELRARFNTAASLSEQLTLVDAFFEGLPGASQAEAA